MTKFLNNDPTNLIEVAWCLIHCNILGNDRADKLAKEATQLAWSANRHLKGVCPLKSESHHQVSMDL